MKWGHKPGKTLDWPVFKFTQDFHEIYMIYEFQIDPAKTEGGKVVTNIWYPVAMATKVLK